MPPFHLRQFICLCLDILTARRPVRQLRRYTTKEAFDRAEQEFGQGAADQTGVLRRVRACRPAAGVIEAVAIVSIGEEVLAVAMRLEMLDARWLCTHLQVI